MSDKEEHTNRRDGCNDLAELQFVQDGGLTSSIETNLRKREALRIEHI